MHFENPIPTWVVFFGLSIRFIQCWDRLLVIERSDYFVYCRQERGMNDQNESWSRRQAWASFAGMMININAYYGVLRGQHCCTRQMTELREQDIFGWYVS